MRRRLPRCLIPPSPRRASLPASREGSMVMEAWFDERFLSVAACDHERAPARIALGLGPGVILAVVAGWAPALVWTVAALALEGPLWRLTRGLAQDGVIEPLPAAGALVLQLGLISVWSFAGLLLWRGG